MAKDQSNGTSGTSGKSRRRTNITMNSATARTGLNLDSSINQVGPGRLTYALNAAIENFDSSSVNYQNEPGNELCLVFTTGYKLIGEHFIPEKRKNIFFLSNPDTGGSEIGYMDNNDCVYRVLINAPCLNFSTQHPIPKIVHRITNCTTEIYWTDGINSRRYLDIEDIPYKLIAGTPSCDPVYGNELDCNQIKLQPNFSIPSLEVSKVENVGSLVAGTYQFAVQYADASGNELTSYYSVTNPTPIADEFVTTVNFDYPVGKSIVISVNDLDITGQFQYFNLAVIKTINNISSAELVGTYNIEEPFKDITYTGADQTPIQLAMIDIFEKFPYYDIAQDVTAVQDVLVWDNLTSIDRINYQSIASQIELKWETHRIPASENYADELNATNLRGYMRDEVYAFEIVFLLRNGKQTDGFHIPGRQVDPPVDNPQDIPSTNSDFIGEPDYYIGDVGYKSYWKVYNTATVSEFSSGYDSTDTSYKGPYQYGEFAFWESTEEYPCQDDVWGDLAGQKIRHHKFPDVLVSPIIENGQIVYDNDQIVPTMQDDAVFPLGVRVNNSEINSLIFTSDLSDDLKDDIVGYKIIRADRGTNKSVIAKGMLRNVNTYTRDEQEYYYPNYPYNDLGGDSYISETNNAWTDESEPWLLYLPSTETIFSWQDFLGGGSGFIEITINDEQGVYEYTSALNGRVAEATIELDTQIEICSLTRPTALLGRILIGPGNYDVYEIASQTCASWGAYWNDPFTDDNSAEVYTSEWLEGWSCFCSSANDSEFARVAQGGVAPQQYGSSEFWPCTVERINQLTAEEEMPPGEITDTKKSRRSTLGCKLEEPLKPITELNDEEGLSYRQIFNSPDTSFGQPFLGNVLKLESVMFGAGKGHFAEVKDNAKYKLLSLEAQQDALESAGNVAGLTDTFSISVAFTIYQTYLTIYINGITRRNYAQSYNSRASYDYSFDIGNNKFGSGSGTSFVGIKQRDIDFARYLIPGVQSLAPNEYNVNNWNRESSVFIKTIENRDFTNNSSVSYIPFPSDTNSLKTPSGEPSIIDKSRYTIGSAGTCSSPEKEFDLSVVSYYASMKNIVVNQYGQIYSYDTVDTGYQAKRNTGGTSTIFGGDIFISRFAYKTKLPFFIDNRVGAPVDSDVFFDEIGNIAYPRFWHSSRSILENAEIDGTIAANFFSYKAHNLDCPNDPSSIDPETGGSYRTFYDGFMYLFAYGIPNFYCETVYNTDLRQAFNNKEGDFWPHVSSGIPDDWLQETNVPIVQDNTYYYNVTFSKQNKENVFTHLPPDWKEDLCYTVYPFRAIYSDAATTSADVRVNNWLVYRALSFHDFPQNYGNLTSLDGIQNKAILARFENKSLLYNNLLTIDTSNPQAAYIGNPNLFDSSPPIDFAETDLGYVGAQNKFLLKIPQGQITVDAKRGQVFLVRGGQVADLTGYGSGVNRFMTDHLPFKILQHFPNVNTDNHFNGIGLHGVYDSKFERVIITKLDYTPLSDDIKYNEETGDFYVELATGASSFNLEVPTPLESICTLYKSQPFEGSINIQYVPCGEFETQTILLECGDPICEGIEICASKIVRSNIGLIAQGSCGDIITTTTTTTTKEEITTTTTTTDKDSITDDTTTTTTTNREIDPPIRIISLDDESYFCNKSWTMSFDFNSNSWISFHSYLPNFYVGENNFYYSGTNTCCVTQTPLSVIAGPVKSPLIVTTSTTTTSNPLFTTTTTTTTSKDCTMKGGFFVPTSCELSGGTGIITVPPTTTTTICARPSTVVEEAIFEGYQIVGQSPVISSGNAKDACDAAGFVTLTSNVQDPTNSTLPIGFITQVNYSLEIGQQAFLGSNGDCTPAPDGWYWTNETYGSNNSVFQIYNGIISDMYDCSCVQTTTTTTTGIPFIKECNNLILDLGNNRVSTANPQSRNLTLVDLTIPGYTSPSDIALTSTKFWSVSSDIKEWDIDQLDPFVATGNELATGPKRTITLPIGFGTVDSIVAIDDTTLIAIDDSSPANGIELDITTLAATGTTKFTLQNNREAISNMLYTTNGRVLVVNKDTLSSIYYISEYEYSTGVLNTEANIGSVEGKVIFEYENNIIIFDSLSQSYILSPTAPYTLINGADSGINITSGSSIMSCVCKSLSANTTTTSTTGAPTTTTTTTISATCNEYEVTGPTAIYYTNCFGQQESISVGSGQTLRVCASVAIPGATLIGSCT